MSLEIKKAHLQSAFYLLAWHLKTPKLFYANADIVYYFFSRMDENTTYRVIGETKNPDIAPSYFGEIMIYTAENSFVAQNESDPTANAALIRFHQDTFLNIEAWYICPLLEANKRIWPYMPRSWIEAYVNKTKNLKKNSPHEYQVYLTGILDFVTGVGVDWWLYPYENILSQIGINAQENILIFIGMFLQACQEQNTKEANKPNLSPEVIKFLEEATKKLDDPPPA
jgi:hypothetical protein